MFGTKKLNDSLINLHLAWAHHSDLRSSIEYCKEYWKKHSEDNQNEVEFLTNLEKDCRDLTGQFFLQSTPLNESAARITKFLEAMIALQEYYEAASRCIEGSVDYHEANRISGGGYESDAGKADFERYQKALRRVRAFFPKKS